ncbi:MAG: transposase [Chloroflexi bacterium]|nr:transposase [Chloroflexota bacterium]
MELLARIALVRAELRLPAALIASYLGAVHQLELSAGAIVGALHRVAVAGSAFQTQVQTAIRASPRVQADETGLRQEGCMATGGASAPTVSGCTCMEAGPKRGWTRSWAVGRARRQTRSPGC